MKFKRNCTAALKFLEQLEHLSQLLIACEDGLMDGTEQQTRLRARRDACAMLLSALPPREERLVRLKYVRCLPPRLIMEKTGYSRSGYYDALARAIEDVQEELEGKIG